MGKIICAVVGLLLIPGALAEGQTAGRSMTSPELLAHCRVFEVCSGDTCFRNADAYGGFWKIHREGRVYVGATSDDLKYEVGFFPSMRDAKRYLNTRSEERNFGRFLIPKLNWIADAHGYTMHIIFSRGKEVGIAEEYSRVIC